MSLYEEFMAMMDRQNFVVLDTETTGLNRGSEICEISIVDHNGTVLLDTYVKPRGGIPYDAYRIHGISDANVANAPEWSALVEQIVDLIAGKDVITYNAQYDRKMFHFADEAVCLPHTEWKTIARWHCAMEMFAEWYGDWNDYHGNYRWQKLTYACEYLKLNLDVKAHSALGDVIMTYALIHHLKKLNYPTRHEYLNGPISAHSSD